MTLSEELAWRGFINQSTFADITDLDKETRTFYLGVDPSSDSMQIGNLAAVMMVRHMINGGHRAVVLVGGATGMIGDPKDDVERQLKALDEIEHNKQGIAAQYRQVLAGAEFELVDNYDWFKEIKYLDFLRDIGKQFSMTQLLDRDFVQTRIGEGTSGISYAEFSYSLIQGYDFLHLYRDKGVTLQIGGSDQWGNMISGVPLVRSAGGDAQVITLPLVINKSTGKKFGKSEGGAVWLDAKKTSPYKFYQFWLNCDDETSEDLIKIYTLLDKLTIEELIATHRTDLSRRLLQRRLAEEVTDIVHGRERRESVERVTDVLFGTTAFLSLTPVDIDLLADEIAVVPLTPDLTVIEALVSSKLCSSNGDARRLLQSGAVSVNGVKLASDQTLTQSSLIKKGKNSFALVR
ncbi:MAG: tyrosine--tRNA ligase [Candidatus Saccharimonas sp.]